MLEKRRYSPSHATCAITRRKDRAARLLHRTSGDVSGVCSHPHRRPSPLPTNSTVWEDRYTVDDFTYAMGYCKHESKLALRSAEIQPAHCSICVDRGYASNLWAPPTHQFSILFGRGRRGPCAAGCGGGLGGAAARAKRCARMLRCLVQWRRSECQ